LNASGIYDTKLGSSTESVLKVLNDAATEKSGKPNYRDLKADDHECWKAEARFAIRGEPFITVECR
jgi:hypothetical protein